MVQCCFKCWLCRSVAGAALSQAHVSVPRAPPQSCPRLARSLTQSQAHSPAAAASAALLLPGVPACLLALPPLLPPSLLAKRVPTAPTRHQAPRSGKMTDAPTVPPSRVPASLKKAAGAEDWRRGVWRGAASRWKRASQPVRQELGESAGRGRCGCRRLQRRDDEDGGVAEQDRARRSLTALELPQLG